MTESGKSSSDEAPPPAQEMVVEPASTKREREDGEGEVEEAPAKKQKSEEGKDAELVILGTKYEHTMLLELIKKGHAEPDKKIGSGIRTFQVRKHPTWKSRCFFLVREDGFVDDFSFRKCVDCILPLPENMKLHNKNNNGNKKFRGHHRGSQARGRGGRGRQGGSRT